MKHPIPEAALDSDIAILAKKGAGKTYTAKGIIERLLDDGARVLILDPLSTWWGLKSSADGESAGYPIAVFGGPHGDMELTEKMARPLGEVIAKNNLPAVMDVAFMKKAEQQRFVRDLLETLFEKNRDPLTLVLEEAHVFAPQSVAGAEASAFHEVDRIARMGRAFGFRLISVTQRSSRLHKDVLTQAATMIALKTQHHLDQKPILDWFTANADKEFAKKVEANLANLGVGEAFVGATDQDYFDRVKFPEITTLDSSATPKRGEKRIEPKTLSEVDLSSVRAALEAPEPEEKKPSKTVTVRDEKAIQAARQDGYEQGYKKGYASGTTDAIGRAIEALRAVKPEQIKRPSGQAVFQPNRQVLPASVLSGELNGPQRKIMSALAAWARLNHHSPTRAQVAFVAGYSPSSGSFNNTVSSLKTIGALDYPNQGALGLNADFGFTSEELPNVFARLNGPQTKVLEEMLIRSVATRDELADAIGYSASSGSFNNTVSSLRTLGLIDYPRKGEVSLQEWVREVA